MKKQHFLFGIAIIILIAVLADLYLWFVAAGNSPDDFEYARAQYLYNYPESLRNARWLTAFSILLLTASGFIFLNLRNSNRGLRVAASVMGLVCAVLLIWKIFSLM
ncbi:hypothetical protein AM493_14845 [Flavobacterium akiainvivens]|uniref:Uncharacterized protein n=1 Tax=Flavobacterium akiainvivens TaxID=1202724 RepID=A0A0M8MJN6_9FLAO|nr:hypothetical protein [Flavobacterium akiainvivens]KOS07177.1 hypothetical protein AM493_14845 [Flavobacterium akiainvivens]SFQ72945.1 hypothetical protein SAMN05444144_11843 [Flavobacterium akiainvivens]